MVRKLLKVDLARALGVSPSLVSRYCVRGMPAHDIELARRWCDAHLAPTLRKGVRRPAAPPAHAAAGPLFTLDDLALLIEDAGERITASLMLELDVDLERAIVGTSIVACAFHDVLEARGIESDLWDVTGPSLRDPEAHARIESLVAADRAVGDE